MHSELSGLPLDFEFRDKHYTCALVDDDLETRYERQRFAKELKRLEMLRPSYTDPDKYEREMRRLRRRQQEGEFTLHYFLTDLRAKLDLEAYRKKAALEVLPLMIRDEKGNSISSLVLKDMVFSIPEKLVELMAESATLSFMPLMDENDRKKKQILPKVRELAEHAKLLLAQAKADASDC